MKYTNIAKLFTLAIMVNGIGLGLINNGYCKPQGPTNPNGNSKIIQSSQQKNTTNNNNRGISKQNRTQQLNPKNQQGKNMIAQPQRNAQTQNTLTNNMHVQDNNNQISNYIQQLQDIITKTKTSINEIAILINTLETSRAGFSTFLDKLYPYIENLREIQNKSNSNTGLNNNDDLDTMLSHFQDVEINKPQDLFDDLSNTNLNNTNQRNSNTPYDNDNHYRRNLDNLYRNEQQADNNNQYPIIPNSLNASNLRVSQDMASNNQPSTEFPNQDPFPYNSQYSSARISNTQRNNVSNQVNRQMQNNKWNNNFYYNRNDNTLYNPQQQEDTSYHSQQQYRRYPS